MILKQKQRLIFEDINNSHVPDFSPIYRTVMSSPLLARKYLLSSEFQPISIANLASIQENATAIGKLIDSFHFKE